jgi:hypothetical protein
MKDNGTSKESQMAPLLSIKVTTSLSFKTGTMAPETAGTATAATARCEANNMVNTYVYSSKY